jgi:hypothetical protein
MGHGWLEVLRLPNHQFIQSVRLHTDTLRIQWDEDPGTAARPFTNCRVTVLVATLRHLHTYELPAILTCRIHLTLGMV